MAKLVIFLWYFVLRDAPAGDLEYDMDSEDEAFLAEINSSSKRKQKKALTDAQFEAAMGAMEVENHVLHQRCSLEVCPRPLIEM